RQTGGTCLGRREGFGDLEPLTVELRESSDDLLARERGLAELFDLALEGVDALADAEHRRVAAGSPATGGRLRLVDLLARAQEHRLEARIFGQCLQCLRQARAPAVVAVEGEIAGEHRLDVGVLAEQRGREERAREA